MSAAREPLDPADLMAFVDGRLAPERARAVAERLRDDPALAEEVRHYEAQREALHARFDPVLEEPIPARMLPAVRSTPRPVPRLAAAAALVLLGAVGGSIATRAHLAARAGRPDVSVAAFVRQAIVSYAAYTPDARRPVEITAAEQQHLLAWLSNRLGRDLEAPFLEERGLTLIGGRLLPGDVDRPAAQFMYATAGGERVTLFLRVIGEGVAPAAFHFEEEAGVSTFYWVDRDWGYALSGPLNRAALFEIAKAVYEQLGR